mmetsp:Transcript_8960/g.20332  ORF Transcript_8960/g.20332 Transcript_8960/m.20332 type:complete len:210 (-) Transcript_8960:224-853(-)
MYEAIQRSTSTLERSGFLRRNGRVKYPRVLNHPSAIKRTSRHLERRTDGPVAYKTASILRGFTIALRDKTPTYARVANVLLKRVVRAHHTHLPAQCLFIRARIVRKHDAKACVQVLAADPIRVTVAPPRPCAFLEMEEPFAITELVACDASALQVSNALDQHVFPLGAVVSRCRRAPSRRVRGNAAAEPLRASHSRECALRQGKSAIIL